MPGTQWNDVSIGYSHTLARKTDGTLWGWGANGPVPGSSSPEQISGTSWVSISAGGHSLAIKCTP